ncbi:hypothetical protein [Marinicrinis lubricantis]|uniref:Uncharacterized protein n=1 Tax=Marinicrinis lubricantis TaxID=2086470 RepID=A0ABW1IR02_9BACL
MRMNTEAVIFDLDNTLLNRKKAFEVYADRFIDQFVRLQLIPMRDPR